MTSDRHLALMALMNEIEGPANSYRRAVRQAAGQITDSPDFNATCARGNRALDDIEQAVRLWVATHPDERTLTRDNTDAVAAWAGGLRAGGANELVAIYQGGETQYARPGDTIRRDAAGALTIHQPSA